MKAFVITVMILFLLSAGANFLKATRDEEITNLLTALVGLGLGIWGICVLFHS